MPTERSDRLRRLDAGGLGRRRVPGERGLQPPPPDYASPGILWGTEEHVRAMFGDVATGFEFERRVNRIDWESVESSADFFMDRFGPLVTARQLLGERFGELRADIIEIWTRVDEADDGTFRLPQEYLLAVVRL